MANGEQFPHIPLLLVRDAPPKKSPRIIPPLLGTAENLRNRALHHHKIDAAIQHLLEEDRVSKAERVKNGLPNVEDHIALFLQSKMGKAI